MRCSPTTRAIRKIRDRGLKPSHLNDIIHARYRKEGYQVTWALFGSVTDARVPDMSSLSRRIDRRDGDTFVSSGIAFEHVTTKRRPDPHFILSQLPRRITHLVIGGFHQWDCVDKMGECAYECGIPVIVDDDTTHLFFSTTALFGEIPLVRPLHSAVDNLIRNTSSSGMKEAIVVERAGKPWFAQPTVR